MRRLKLLLIFAPYFLNAQGYRSEEPKIINVSYTGEETLKTAWFCPADTFLVAGTYQKIEIGIDLPPAIDQKIERFFKQNGRRDQSINPYSTADILVSSEITSPKGEKKMSHGFYYEEYKKDLARNKWIQDTTSFDFRLRFTLPEAGHYTVKVILQSKNFRSLESQFELDVVTSENPGYLQVGRNGKHLSFSGSNKSFYGVGQVIPWTDWENWEKADLPSGPQKFEEIYNALRTLDNAQGNFTRFVAAPWFMQLEWEALGNYQPKMGQAWEFDRIVESCEAMDIYFLFCALMQSPLVQRPDEKEYILPRIRWETYCYNDNDQTPSEVAAEPPLGIQEPIEFFSNVRAIRHSKDYFRYLIARYGYSTSLAGWQLVSEVDETAEYRDELKDGVAVDHSSNRLHVRDWTRTMSDFIHVELGDPHMISIAMINGKGYSKTFWDPELFDLENIDFFGFHDYVFEQEYGKGKILNRNLLYRYPTVREVNMGFQNGSISYPSYQGKPFIYDEFGHILVIPRPEGKDNHVDPVVEFNNCADFMFKQDLWFTFASGCAVAGLDWWNQDQYLRHEMWKKFFPSLMKFAADIDFEKINYTEVRLIKDIPMIAQRWPLTEKEIRKANDKNYRKDDLLEAYIQVSADQAQGFGWMMNRSVNWPNLVEEYPCIQDLVEGKGLYSKPYLVKPEDDDIPDLPIDIASESQFIKIYGLKKRTEYQVRFFSTITGLQQGSVQVKTNGKGILKLLSPAMNHQNDPDLAFKFLELGRLWNNGE
ncbi:MAG: hypothetical protein ACK47F_04010 [Flavobacteriales bacterium]